MSKSPETQFERTFLLFILDRLRRDHEIGDLAARHEALRMCIRHGYPMPDWLAYLEDVDSAVALGEACYVKHRDARSPATRHKQIYEKRMIAAALLACRNAKIQGEEKLSKASEMLQSFGIYRDASTLRSPKLPFEPTPGEYEAFRQLLDIKIGFYGGIVPDDES